MHINHDIASWLWRPSEAVIFAADYKTFTRQIMQEIGKRLGGGGIAMAIAMAMKDKHYTNKTIRLDNPVWEQLKKRRRKFGKSWNLFIKFLLSEKHDNGKSAR